MQRAEFDKFADEYRALLQRSISVSGEAPEFFAEYKVADVAAITARESLTVQRVLDVGAGTGTSTPFFRRYYPPALLVSADVSERCLEIGSARSAGEAHPVCFDGQTLPFADDSFDVAFAACVFHHVDRAEHVRLVSEMARVTRPGGIVVLFEHNPLNPLTVRAVNSCPFDENAQLLRAGQLKATFRKCGFHRPKVAYRLFFPGFMRRLRPLERWLKACPLGAQYYIYGVVPNAR